MYLANVWELFAPPAEDVYGADSRDGTFLE